MNDRVEGGAEHATSPEQFPNEILELEADRLALEARTAARNARRPRHGGSILMAAMIGLADALGFDREREPTEQVQDAPDPTGGDFDLQFGHLPPLR